QTRDEIDKQKNWDLKLRSLRDLAERKKDEKWGPVFDLTNVARLVEQKSPVPVPNAARQYKKYEVPEDKKELINARPDLADQLLKALKEPGDTTVVWDQPEKTYYLALLDCAESLKQLEQDFFADYKKPAKDDQLLMRLVREQQGKYIRGVMEQL